MEKITMGEPKSVTELRDADRLGILSGVFETTNPDYHAGPGLSYSGLKEFSISPAHYQAYLTEPREQTASQLVGELFHMRTLERERFDRMVSKVDNRQTKENKAIIAEKEAAGGIVCTSKEYEKVCRMSDAVLAHPFASSLLIHPQGQNEVSVFSQDPLTGITLKCRPDRLIQTERFIVCDLKYYSDLSENGIRSQIRRMKYHWQAAFYLHVCGLVFNRISNLFCNIFVEDKAPFAVRVVVLDDASLERAYAEIMPLLEKFSECQKLGVWPAFEDGVFTTSLPDLNW